MAREASRNNEKAPHLNPEKSGVKSGNPQLEVHEGGSPTTPGENRPRLPELEEEEHRN